MTGFISVILRPLRSSPQFEEAGDDRRVVRDVEHEYVFHIDDRLRIDLIRVQGMPSRRERVLVRVQAVHRRGPSFTKRSKICAVALSGTSLPALE